MSNPLQRNEGQTRGFALFWLTRYEEGFSPVSIHILKLIVPLISSTRTSTRKVLRPSRIFRPLAVPRSPVKLLKVLNRDEVLRWHSTAELSAHCSILSVAGHN